MRFVIENTDKEMIKLNDILRSNFKKNQPSIFTLINQEQFSEMLIKTLPQIS